MSNCYIRYTPPRMHACMDARMYPRTHARTHGHNSLEGIIYDHESMNLIVGREKISPTIFFMIISWELEGFHMNCIYWYWSDLCITNISRNVSCFSTCNKLYSHHTCNEDKWNTFNFLVPFMAQGYPGEDQRYGNKRNGKFATYMNTYSWKWNSLRYN